MYPRRWLFVALFVVSGVLVACAGTGPRPSAEERQALAPNGPLRVGVYPGSPTSLVTDRGTGEAKGVTHDLGKALAERLGVAFELVEMPTLAELLVAVKSGAVDFTGTNASPSRAAEMDFTPTVLEIELGYLVVAASTASVVSDVDRPGIRIGVTQGSTSQTTLPRALKSAIVVPAPPLKAAGGMLTAGDIDAFATNKVILFEMSDGIQGSRVLGGRWGVEHWALAVPKGRQNGLKFVQRFAEWAQSEGLVRRAVDRAGLRGTVRPEP